MSHLCVREPEQGRGNLVGAGEEDRCGRPPLCPCLLYTSLGAIARQVKGIELDGGEVDLRAGLDPVSYTHLDVYKRQG